MSLTAGTRLGPYEIVAPLGAGGMGEVYRARDPRLGRDVAIKVLPPEVAGNPDRLRRFEQEARAVAALNHSNILAVHDIGVEQSVSFIVTELLDGRTLRELLDQERLSISRAIDLGAQIADGLAAAHGRGMVHRDLKPENIHVTHDGRAKILDFGLAKTIDGSTPAIEAPTQSGTAPFTVLGTAGYMAPEQVRGQPVDHRADIFSFGAVLYEMVTSRRAFVGDSVPDTMSAILREPPAPISSTPDRPIPPSLLRIIDRCLDKAPAGRFQSTTDLAFALKSLSHADTGTMTPIGPGAPYRDRLVPRWRRAVPWAIAAAGALAALTAWYWRPSAAPVRAVGSGFTFTIDPPAGTFFGATQVSPFPAISPDGQTLAFLAARPDQDAVIWVRRMDQVEARTLPRTGRAAAFFWSPDSRSLAFFQDDQLKRIELESGVVQPICAAIVVGGGQFLSGTWGADGSILFADRGKDGRVSLRRVPASGGEPATLLSPPEGQIALLHPAFLPDGRRFLYQSKPDGRIWVSSLDGAAPKALLTADSRAVHASPGWLLFVRDGILLAQSFDPNRLELAGSPQYVAEDVRTNADNGRSAFTVSMSGVLVYRTGDWADERTLVWLDRKGQVLKEIKAAAADYRRIALVPPDDRAAIVHIHDAGKGGGDLFRIDLETGGRTPITSDPGHDEWPVLSPDGSEVAWQSDRSGKRQIFRKSSTGAGAETLFISHEWPVLPNQWSKTVFVFEVETPTKGSDLWVARLGGPQPELEPYLSTQYNEIEGRLSPDEKWMAYQSAEGAQSAVLVRPFPEVERRKDRISGTTAASGPRWSPLGNELFYVDRPRDKPILTSLSATIGGSTISFGTATPLLDLSGVVPGSPAVSHDGQRFLVARTVGNNLPTPLTVVIDWTARLARAGR